MRGSERDTTALALGSVISGLLAYLFFALSTRSLGAVAAAPVTVLWTYWSFTAAALTFPLQHWIARSAAAHHGEGAVRRALPGVAAVVTAIALTAGLLAWLARDALFARGGAWFALLVGGVTLGSAFIGVVRGALAARRRFVAVAMSMVLENGVRCLAAAALIAFGAESAVAVGSCLVAGGLAGLVWPSAVVLVRDRAARAVESPLRFLSGASGGQLLAQAVLTSGPVVLALGGGSAAQVTALFAALALFRAPYTLGIGLVSQLTGRATTMFVRGQQAALRRIRVRVVTGTVLAAVGAGVAGSLIGPALLRAVFGSDVRLSAPLSAVVAVGCTVALTTLVLAVMILAQSRSHVVARAWVVAVLGGALVYAVLPESPLTRTCWAFLAAETLAFGVLLVEEVRGSTRRTGRSLAGSSA